MLNRTTEENTATKKDEVEHETEVIGVSAICFPVLFCPS